MLVVTRQRNKRVMIGDHSIITVLGIDRENDEVRLGFITRDPVDRVDWPDKVVKAAKIEAKLLRSNPKKRDKMARLPVFVAHTVDEEAPQIKAALTRDKATYPGAKVVAVDDTTKLAPKHHQFLVIRCFDSSEVKTIRRLNKQALDWVYMDTIEHSDVTVYALFVRTTTQKEEADVKYIDLIFNDEP